MIYAVIVVPDERCPLLVAGLVTNGVNLSGGGGGDAEICANFVRRLFVITAFSADIKSILYLSNIYKLSLLPVCIHFLSIFKPVSIHEQLKLYMPDFSDFNAFDVSFYS